MDRLKVLAAIGIAVLIVAITVAGLFVFDFLREDEPQDVSTVVEVEATTTEDEITVAEVETTTAEVETTEAEVGTIAESVSESQGWAEFGESVKSENSEEFSINTPTGGILHYTLDTSKFSTVEWVHDINIFKALCDDAGFDGALDWSRIEIKDETYTVDGNAITVNFIYVLVNGTEMEYTLTVDVNAQLIYSNF